MNNINVVGLFCNPWCGDYSQHQSLAELYRRAVWLKANPRDERYMSMLFAERYPGGRFVNFDTDATWQKALATADTVVLVYPDSIGLHFNRLEASVGQVAKTWATVRVLNGRRRDFVWSRRVRRALRWRRVIEHTMLGEAFATIMFLAITPWFVIIDVAKGRR